LWYLVFEAPAGKCDLKQIRRHPFAHAACANVPGIGASRVARITLGGCWGTRACPRHVRSRVPGTFLRSLRAQMFPALGHARARARCVRKGSTRVRCQRKHCRAMALQSALRLTPVSWASQQGCPSSTQNLVTKGREARQRNRTGPSQAQSRPMTRASSRHQTRALRPAPVPVSLKVVKVQHPPIPFHRLQDVMLIRGGNRAGRGRIMKTRRRMSRRGHVMADRERPHSLPTPWLRAERVPFLARSHKMG
jgi:hypothetical protein